MEQQPRTGRAVSPFLRQLTALEREKAAAPQRYALRHLPRPLPGKQCPRGEVHNTIGLAYKVLGCLASFEEGESSPVPVGRPAGKRSSPGSGRRLAPGTLLASRGRARMEQGALHWTENSRAGTGPVRRCLIYPRPRGGQQQVLFQPFHHPASTCGFPARGA